MLSVNLRPISNLLSPPSNGWSSKTPPRNLPLASRIVVKNLPYSTGEANLLKLFSKFGKIVEVKIARHEHTMMPKGYAFIQYTSQEDAFLAMENMDQKIFGGRIMYAEIAKPSIYGLADYIVGSGPPPVQPH